MTVNTENIITGPYAGNDIANEFSYDFRIEDSSQIEVYQTIDDGVQTILELDTDYIVDSVGDDAGGLITRVSGALPTGYKWWFRANYSQTQETAFNSQGGFFPDVHELAMDKMTFLIQQLQDEANRSIKVTVTSDIDPDDLVESLFEVEQNASDSADSAAEQVILASEQVTLATEQVTLAAEQVTKASEWAENPEDTPVEVGEYSALHWAAKAKADAESLDLTPYALLASPSLTGTPTAPTPTVGDDSENIATTEFVQNELNTRVKIVDFGTVVNNNRYVIDNPFGNAKYEGCIVRAEVYYNGMWTGSGTVSSGAASQMTVAHSNAEGIVVQTGTTGVLYGNAAYTGGGYGSVVDSAVVSAPCRVIVTYIGDATNA